MKLIIKIREINYADVAVKVMPLLEQAVQKQNNAIGKTISALSQLPQSLIYRIFETIPELQKNEIVAAFAMENRETICRTINKMSQAYEIGVMIDDFTMNPALEIIAVADSVDYLCIVNRFLPMIREKLLSMGGMAAVLRPVIQMASAEQICGLIDRILGERKDAFVASMIQQNQQMLISAIENAARKQDISLKIDSIILQA